MTAIAMPGRTPRNATPAKAAIDEPELAPALAPQPPHAGDVGERQRRDDDHRGQGSAGAGTGGGPARRRASARSAAAPTTPVSWVFAPARSATAVRDPLVLTGNPWNRPAADVGGPDADHLLVRRGPPASSVPRRPTRWRWCRPATRWRCPTAPPTRIGRSPSAIHGMVERRQAARQDADERDAAAGQVEHDGDDHRRRPRR